LKPLNHSRESKSQHFGSSRTFRQKKNGLFRDVDSSLATLTSHVKQGSLPLVQHLPASDKGDDIYQKLENKVIASFFQCDLLRPRLLRESQVVTCEQASSLFPLLIQKKKRLEAIEKETYLELAIL